MKPFIRRTLLLSICIAAAPVVGGPGSFAHAQTAAQAGAPANRLIGTVTATGPDSLTLKLESGGEATIAVVPQTRLLRTAPGARTLTGATAIQLSDLAAGDRVLVRVTPGADATHYTATAVISMKQQDIAQAHATESEDWQKRGVGGVVKSVDVPPGTAAPGSASIVLNTGLPGHTVTIDVTPATMIRRYAPDSVNFADSKPSSLAEIHPGDQLRARGEHSEDAATVKAVEIVAGSFRNIAGRISSIDPAQNTLTVNDLTTKRPVVLHLTAQTAMRKLPPEMAQRLARAASGGEAAGGASAGTGAGGPPNGARPAYASGGAESGGRPRGDMASMLQRAPDVTLADLKKGDAVMVVSTQGSGQPGAQGGLTAITLIAGVEPLLEGSSSASQNLFSASWNLGGGGAAAEAQQ